MTELPIEDRIRRVSSLKEGDLLQKELDSMWWKAVIESDMTEQDRVASLRSELMSLTKYMVDLSGAPVRSSPPPARGGPMERATLVGGQKMHAHAAGTCAGYWCCIHRPSPHHMTMWTQEWEDSHMYRVCSHGLQHPDPDDFVNYDTLVTLAQHKKYCDGCCTNPYFDKDLL